MRKEENNLYNTCKWKLEENIFQKVEKVKVKV